MGTDEDPADVFGSEGVYGGSPHMRGVQSVSWVGIQGRLLLESPDVPIVVPGTPTPFVTPRTEQPNMTKGVNFNVYNNIWYDPISMQLLQLLLLLLTYLLPPFSELCDCAHRNTNYVLWYPFVPEDANTRSRYQLVLRAP